MSAQRGFTMIETLIAILVFSLGLIGMAGLMVVSVKTNHSAYLRTQATFLAESLVNRMRINRGQINSYNLTYGPGTVGPDPCANAAPCEPALMVARDVALWSQQLVTMLPNPTATVACDGLPLYPSKADISPYTGLCRIRIQWSESALQSGDGVAPNTQVFAWVFEP